ncbi:MAG: hypothetical protein AAF415_10890 [Pseudomonadota bacterium]
MVLITHSPRFAAWADRLLPLGVALFVLGLFAVMLLYPFGRDQAIYAVVAQTLTEGGAPYRDAWDFKTPAIFFVYAAAQSLLGEAEAMIRLFEILLWLTMGVGYWLITRRLMDGRAALLCFAVAIYCLVRAGYWHVGQPESFGAVALVWALVLALDRRADPPFLMLRAVAIAALYTFAALLKPPLGGGILVSYGVMLARIWPVAGLPGALRLTLGFTLGGLLVLGAFGAYFAATGSWGDFVDAVLIFAPQYTAISHTELGPLQALGKTLRLMASFWFLLPAGLICLALFCWRDWPVIGAALHIGGVAFVALCGVALQAKFFHYHYASAVGLLALPAGWGLWMLWQRVRGRPLALAGLGLALAVAMLKLPHDQTFWWKNAQRLRAEMGQDPAGIHNRIYSNQSFAYGDNLAAATWLRRNAPEDARLAVWGFEPILFYRSGLGLYHRYIYNIPMLAAWSKAEARAEFMAGFATAPPWAVVVQSNDTLAYVSGDPRTSREMLEQDFPALREELARGYESTATFGPLEIYTRIGGS